MDTTYSVTIVIPAYNAEAVLARCIEACLAQEYGGRVEVVVVDDGSTDGTAQLAAPYPVRYLRQTNRGPAAARNAGARATNAELVCFTDSDCAPRRTWVRTLAAEFADAEVGAAGGSYDIGNPGSLLASFLHEEIVHRHRLMPREVNFLGSFNLCCRREAFERAGGFDVAYRLPSAEDNDFSYRLHKLGYRLRFNAQARVAHLYPSRVLPYLRRQFWHGFWAMKLLRSHPEKILKDDYRSVLDGLEATLFLVALVLVPLVLVRQTLWALTGVTAVLVVLQIARAAPVAWRAGNARLLALAPVAFARGFARALGVARGLWHFWVCRR